MKEYLTHTGLLIQLQEHEGNFLVSQTGTNPQPKIIYAGKDADAADKAFEYWKAHYEERRKAEA